MAKNSRAEVDPLVLVMELARKDPQFFHDLVFAPKKAISKLPSLSRATKLRLLKVKAGSLLASIPGLVLDCGNAETCSGATCDNTCAESCGGQTCGGGSCQSTCENSCDETVSPPERSRLGRASLVRVRWARAGVRATSVRKRVTARAKARR
jgi:hypothetical protein